MEPISWQAYEYEYREKGPDWFWAVVIIAGSLAVTASLLGNFLFAVLVVVGVSVLLLYARRKPSLLSYEVGERGVKVSRQVYPYEDIESFWVDDRDGDGQLLLKLKVSSFSPLIGIPLGDTSGSAVRAFLGQYLPEEKHEEPLSQKVMEFLGF